MTFIFHFYILFFIQVILIRRLNVVTTRLTNFQSLPLTIMKFTIQRKGKIEKYFYFIELSQEKDDCKELILISSKLYCNLILVFNQRCERVFDPRGGQGVFCLKIPKFCQGVSGGRQGVRLRHGTSGDRGSFEKFSTTGGFQSNPSSCTSLFSTYFVLRVRLSTYNT